MNKSDIQTDCVMVGPGPDGQGGIASVVKVYGQADLFADGSVIMLPSFNHGSGLTKAKDALFSLVKYASLLLRGKGAVLHVHAASRASFWRKSLFIWLAHLSGRRVIFHLHGGAFTEFVENLSPFYRRLAIATLNCCDQILCLTTPVQAWLANLVPAVPVQWWPNPVSADLLKLNAPAEQREPLVLYLGALVSYKGLIELLDAFVVLHTLDPTARLVLGGSGPEQTRLQTIVTDLGLDDCVQFLGWIGLEEKKSWLQRARVLVLASHTEGQPMVLLEAMASGVAVVSTNVGGIPDLISDGVHGLLVPPQDVAALSKALTTIWQDGELRVRMVAAAHELVSTRHRADQVCLALKKLYRDLVIRHVNDRPKFSLRYRLIDLLRGSDSVGLLKKLQKWQYQTPEQISQYSRTELAKYIFELRSALPMYKNVTQYSDFPVIDKQFIKRNFNKIMNPFYKGRLIQKKTGGSTGEPLVYYTGADSLSYLWAGIYLSWQVAGYRLGDRVVFLAGSAISSVGFKQKIYYRLLNVTLLSSFNMSNDSMENYGRLLQRSDFKLLYGYSAAVHRLARYYLDAGKTLKTNLRGIVCAAESLTPVMRKEIEAAFGVPCFSQYGCNDAGISAYECEERNGFHLITVRCYHEVLPDGELVSTDLSNHAMFLPRYNTGDIVRMSNRVCPCGRGFPLIDEVVGRQNDMVVDAKGNAVHSEFFSHMFRGDERIFSFQVLFNQDRLDVNLHLTPLSDMELSLLDSTVRSKINQALAFQEVRVVFNQPFKTIPNGKHRFVVKENI
ncbi:phenylacetate-coenzyme A ligase PaaK-like adenylate-forming protein/glycosyltransferase involved in cell wall biosynthesis [Oxalobacteraceae bacterium GrIS 2.11]